MRNWLMIALVAGLTVAGTAYSATETVDFETIEVGTVVTGPLGTISPNFAIYNYGALNAMRVVVEGGGTRAYSASGVSPTNNWLPGENARCFGNDADATPRDSMDDLWITFHPDIVVTRFSIDLADFGDFGDSYSTDPNLLVATLTAYDADDVSLNEYVLSLPKSSSHDASQGLKSLAVEGADIAYVKLIFASMDRGTGFDNLKFDYTTRTLAVDIDIKPGSNPNSFNINGNGVIPVAILGSKEFDVECIDPATVTLSGLKVAMRGKDKLMVAYEDVIGPDDTGPDGYTDLVIKFEDDSSMWNAGESMAELKGNLKADCGGTPISGWDWINVVP